jgi:hypothetical protein
MKITRSHLLWLLADSVKINEKTGSQIVELRAHNAALETRLSVMEREFRQLAYKYADFESRWPSLRQRNEQDHPHQWA